MPNKFLTINEFKTYFSQIKSMFTNFKTINGQSIIGKGNIVITSSSGGVSGGILLAGKYNKDSQTGLLICSKYVK